MCATRVVGATLINTVKYNSDRASLKRVRKELQALKQLSQKASSTAAKAEIDQAKAVAKAQLDVAKKAIKLQQAEYKKATKNNSGMVGSSAGYDPKAVERANRAMANAAQKQVSADLRAAEKAKKSKDKQRKDATNRDIGATMATRKIAFDINRMQGLDIGQRYTAIQQAKELADQMRRGAIDTKEMNEAMRQLKATTSATAREARKLARREGKAATTGNSNFLASGAVLGSGVGKALGIAGAGYLVYSASRDAISSGVETQQGRRMMQAQGLDPFEGEAIRRTVRTQTGMDFSADKISDIAKDTQDKQGQLSQGSWNKKGQFTGGGELSAWANIMVSRGGYTQQGAIQTLQSAKGPGELAVILQNLKKQAHLTDSEFTSLAESINDFSFIAKSAGDGGQNFITMMQQMSATGSQLTQKQQDAVNNLDKLGTAASDLSSDLKSKFTASFAQSLSDAGVSTKTLNDAFVQLTPVVTDLGKIMGNLLGWLVKIPSKDAAPEKADPNDNSLFYKTSSGSTGINLDWADSILPDWLTNKFNSPTIGPAAVLADRGNGFYGSNPFGTSQPALNQQVQTNVIVQIDDPALKNVFNALADSKIDNYHENMTWDINQSVLKN
jgi:hypothetical protein